ncbi:MAG: transglutaminase domain-containing protein [Actinobacteria bacterium]|nr:transglutaminase domain-containing protein [Actinomycetota bacterium]
MTARTGIPRRSWADLAVVVMLLAVAISPLASAFQGAGAWNAGFWTASGAGILLGTGIAVLGAWRRWGSLVVAVLAVLGYFLMGGAVAHRDIAVAGFVPTLGVLSALALDSVQVWRQMLTLPAPFQGFDALSIAPFLATLVTSTVAVSLALRTRRVLTALIPVGILFVFAVLFGTSAGFFPIAVGVGLAALAIGWAAWCTRRDRARGDIELPGEASTPRGHRVAAAVVAGAVVAVACAGGGVASVLTASDRDVLRAHVVPPLELHDYASPLMSFRKWTRDGTDSALFTVTGLPSGVPVRLATLDLYDGIVYKVSGAGGAGSGDFRRVGGTIDDSVRGTHRTVTVRIDGLGGVWMPTVGYLDGFAATAKLAPDAVNYDAATGTAVVTTGLTTGSSYTLDVTVPAEPSEAALAKAQFAHFSTPTPARVPDAVAGIVAEAVPSGGTPYEQVKALETYFRKGYFSHGLAGQAPSRSGHSLSREAALLGKDQMVGDDEQYSVAMALALAQLGVPVRVVLGFTPSISGGAGAAHGTSVAVTGKDVHAWVEVPFEGAGWVAFHPTPPEDRVPTEQTPQPKQKPHPQVPQPPQQPQEPAQLPPAPPVQDSQKGDQPLDLSWLWTTLQITGVSLLVLLALCGPSLALTVLRVRRRTGREHSGSTVGRVDGGWAELIDTAADVGLALPRGGTRREQGAVLDEQVPGAGVATLARWADQAVFGADDPADVEARSYWDEAEAARRLLARAMPWHRRLRARLFPASVLRAIRRPSLRDVRLPRGLGRSRRDAR